MPTSTEDVVDNVVRKDITKMTDLEEFTDSSPAEIVVKKDISDEIGKEMTNGQESTDIGLAEC